MRISDAGLDIIKKYEGLRLAAYFCPAGVPTIGYGHTKTVTGTDVRNRKFITLDEADRLLKEDIKFFEDQVTKLVTVPLNQNQFDALVSLVYNIGPGAFKGSTLRLLLNSANYKDAADQFGVWRRGGGKVLPGLVKRRAEERELFLT